MTFPLNVQQSASFVSFFSLLVSNASFDRRSVKSSFRKIFAFRCCVLCFFNVNLDTHNSFSAKSDYDGSTAGTLST